MSGKATMLATLLDEWDGHVEPPSNLEALIRDLQPSDVCTLFERLMDAARADFSDIPGALEALPTLMLNESQQLARRIGWIFQTLVTFNTFQMRPKLRIEAALASVAVWDSDGCFWEIMSSRLSDDRQLLKIFEDIACSRGGEFRVHAGAPTWEREHLHDLQRANHEGDWPNLAERAAALKGLPYPDPCVVQATRALAILDWPRLTRLANKTTDWVSGHMLLSPLSLLVAFRLATASTSTHLRFAALERVVRRERRTLTSEEEAALKNFLLVLAKDGSDWPRWLAVFNRYPIRNPHMQCALGRALARTSEAALSDYVKSISLHISDGEGRACVTRCLSKFRARADLSRRRALWREAYERWRAWGFGSDEGNHLTIVARCELDYGVVGWFVEGAAAEASQDPDQSFEQNLLALDMQWHAAVSAAVSGFFLLLSRHQVLAHAKRSSASGLSWLPGPTVYVPPAVDTFTRRRYNWDGGDL